MNGTKLYTMPVSTAPSVPIIESGASPRRFRNWLMMPLSSMRDIIA